MSFTPLVLPMPAVSVTQGVIQSWISTKCKWFKWFPISNDVIVVITNLQNCEIVPWLMNTDRAIHYVEWKIGPLFQFVAWNIGAEPEQSGPKIWWVGAEQRAGVKKIGWSGSGSEAGGHGAGNGAGCGSHRNRFEWRAEILLLLLRSHALLASKRWKMTWFTNLEQKKLAILMYTNRLCLQQGNSVVLNNVDDMDNADECGQC